MSVVAAAAAVAAACGAATSNSTTNGNLTIDRRDEKKSTTFVHAKYAMIDGKTASVSSVNWSRNSFTNDREAGILISGTGAARSLEFLQSVFESDYAAGADFQVTNKYSAADMKTITSSAKRTVTVPPGPTGRCVCVRARVCVRSWCTFCVCVHGGCMPVVRACV